MQVTTNLQFIKVAISAKCKEVKCNKTSLSLKTVAFCFDQQLSYTQGLFTRFPEVGLEQPLVYYDLLELTLFLSSLLKALSVYHVLSIVTNVSQISPSPVLALEIVQFTCLLEFFTHLMAFHSKQKRSYADFLNPFTAHSLLSRTLSYKFHLPHFPELLVLSPQLRKNSGVFLGSLSLSLQWSQKCHQPESRCNHWRLPHCFSFSQLSSHLLYNSENSFMYFCPVSELIKQKSSGTYYPVV